MSSKMVIEHGYFKDSEKIELKTDFLRILGEDGRVMFEIRLENDHSISISSGDIIKVGDKLYDDKMIIIPKVSNNVIITKPEYK